VDILIRGIPDEVAAAIEGKAGRLGLSRSEYIRQTLERDASTADLSVTANHLQQLAQLTIDLDDPGIMSNAWS